MNNYKALIYKIELIKEAEIESTDEETAQKKLLDKFDEKENCEYVVVLQREKRPSEILSDG
jgi:hypothetical protein